MSSRKFTFLDGETNSNRAIEFERHALNTLKNQAIAEGKLFFLGRELPSRFETLDALAPNGIMSFSGPTLIEIKLDLSQRALDSVEHIIGRHASEIGSALIVAHDFDGGNRLRIHARLQARFPNILIRILNRGDLDAINSSRTANSLFLSKNLSTEFDALVDAVRQNAEIGAEKNINVNKQHIAALSSSS